MKKLLPLLAIVFASCATRVATYERKEVVTKIEHLHDGRVHVFVRPVSHYAAYKLDCKVGDTVIRRANLLN